MAELVSGRALAATFGCVLVAFAIFAGGRRAAAQVKEPLTRIAEIEVDPQQLEPYKAALREEMEAAVRLEPGALSLYAVTVEGHPEQVRIFEVYASQAAYEQHLQTPHFKKYKIATAGMVRSLKLVDTTPVSLRVKPGFTYP